MSSLFMFISFAEISTVDTILLKKLGKLNFKINFLLLVGKVESRRRILNVNKFLNMNLYNILPNS